MSETVTSQDQAKEQTGAEAGAESGRPPEDATRAERSSEDQLVREGDIPRDSTVLYAHLGGQPALNAYHTLWP